MKCSNAFKFLILLCFLSTEPSFAGDMGKTFADTKKQADQGDATAQFNLGRMNKPAPSHTDLPMGSDLSFRDVSFIANSPLYK